MLTFSLYWVTIPAHNSLLPQNFHSMYVDIQFPLSDYCSSQFLALSKFPQWVCWHSVWFRSLIQLTIPCSLKSFYRTYVNIQFGLDDYSHSQSLALSKLPQCVCWHSVCIGWLIWLTIPYPFEILIASMSMFHWTWYYFLLIMLYSFTCLWFVIFFHNLSFPFCFSFNFGTLNFYSRL